MALLMAAAIASAACAAERSCLAFCCASVCIWDSSLPLGFVLEASLAGGGDPSRRFFRGGGEPADEEVPTKGGGWASGIGGREFRTVELGAAVFVFEDRIEKEFWVAIPEDATASIEGAGFLCFFGIFKRQN